jgi:hypothetical protein
MSVNNSFQESPPYWKVMQQPGATYQTTKVSLRVDEASLSNSVQQPQITEPRAIPWSAFRPVATKAEHNFVFAVCFGSGVPRERLARVSVCCQQQQKRDDESNRVQFDVILGNTQCLIENLVSPKDSLSILVTIAPAVGEANNAALQRSEKIYSFALTIFIAPTNQGEMRTTVIMGQQMQFVPSFSASAKPKRPRGRPPGKRADDATSLNSPMRDRSSEDDDNDDENDGKPEKPSKKRVRDASAAIATTAVNDVVVAAAAAAEEKERKRVKCVPDSPPMPLDLFSDIPFYNISSSRQPPPLSISFSEIDRKSVV